MTPCCTPPPPRSTEFDDELRTLVADMFETMDEAPGVGLAGPQVGVPLRLFVYGWTRRRRRAAPRRRDQPDAVASARCRSASPTRTTESEGCLSFPGERFPLRRAERAILQAIDLDGEPYEMRAEGWLARIFQHEYDHLDGVLYVDRLDAPVREGRRRRSQRKNGWGVPGLSWLPGRDHLED